MRLLLSLFIGKSIYILTRIFKLGGGSAAPGLYALKINPDLIANLSKFIPKTIIITGTNGKTTTTRLLTHFVKNQNLKVITNNTGSNLARGIASTLIQYSNLHLSGVRLNFDLAIWELDEAAFNNLAPILNPDLIIILNIFRDQLDRYGEVDTIVNKWSQTLQNLKLKDIPLLINGDDATLKLLKTDSKKVKLFGVETDKIEGEKINLEKSILDLQAQNIHLNGLDGSGFTVIFGDKKYKIDFSLPGIYNIYNLLAALGAIRFLKLSIDESIKFLNTFSPAFGRMEKITIRGTDGYIFLIKNPTGATQVLNIVSNELKANDSLLLALNDNFADGTDVSWIWDCEFELLKDKNIKIVCSGTRAEELVLRLKYAGVSPKNCIVEKNLYQGLNKSLKDLQGRVFMLPTYTALLDLQTILVNHGIKQHYWREN